MLKEMARFAHGLLPESGLKRQLSALAYRMIYGKRIRDYRIKNGTFELVLANGMEIKSICEFDPEPLVGDLMDLKLESGSVAIDLGGHYGVVSVYLSSLVGSEGRVITFEADQKNFEILKQNLEFNEVSNVEVLNLGVYDRTGTLEFHSGGSYTSSFHETSYVEKNLKKYDITQMQVVTLDERLTDLDRLDFIKIDIEGSEVEAIRGGKNILGRFFPRLIIETHIVAGKSTADEVEKLLREIGYRNIQRKEDVENMPTLLVEKG